MKQYFCASVAEVEESSKKKSPNVPAKRRPADMEAVAKQARTERADHTARVTQLKGGFLEPKCKLEFLERHNNGVDYVYFATR